MGNYRWMGIIDTGRRDPISHAHLAGLPVNSKNLSAAKRPGQLSNKHCGFQFAGQYKFERGDRYPSRDGRAAAIRMPGRSGRGGIVNASASRPAGGRDPLQVGVSLLRSVPLTSDMSRWSTSSFASAFTSTPLIAASTRAISSRRSRFPVLDHAVPSASTARAALITSGV